MSVLRQTGLTARHEAAARRILAETRATGRQLQTKVDREWLWKGRRVYAYDGATVMMPDTPENQQAYPQNVAQQPGLGFPIAKIAAVFSLACGVVIDLGICRYAGKGQSELGLLRTLMNVFLPGDVMLGDRMMCAWTEMAMLRCGRRLCLPIQKEPEGRLPPRDVWARGSRRRLA
jgi:hypothetical protein